MKSTRESLEKKYPMVKKYDSCLFEDYLHHLMIMLQVSERIDIPLEELMSFFYKGKIKLDLLEREEEEYGRQSVNFVREMSKDNGRE